MAIRGGHLHSKYSSRVKRQIIHFADLILDLMGVNHEYFHYDSYFETIIEFYNYPTDYWND